MSCRRGCCATQSEHYRSVTIYGPSSQRDAARRESRDMDAYRRLVQSGVQPRQIAGASDLERGASTSHEVEHAAIITDPQERAKVTRAFEMAKDFAVTPLGGSDAS